MSWREKWGGKGNEKLYVLKRKNKYFSVSIGSIFSFFDWWVIFVNMGVIFDPFNQLILYFLEYN